MDGKHGTGINILIAHCLDLSQITILKNGNRVYELGVNF
jgi:hypothetical protein